MRKLILGVVTTLLLAGCGRGQLGDTDEVGHSVGDVMSSFDEAAQGGAFAAVTPYLKRPELDRRPVLEELSSFVLPYAHAAGCSTVHFGGCSAGAMSKTFSNCSFGGATLDGSVNLTFSDAQCSMAGVGASVTRVANFTLTGPRNGTLTVSAPGGGQKVTRTGADAFNYTVLGMHREAADGKGKKLFDFDTKTLADIGITGTSRANRTMNGGKLQITHNLKGYVTELVPNNVKWNTSCNCAVSGQWTGTVTENGSGQSESFVIDVTGCGTVKVTVQNQSRDVTLDRCSAM